jgi:hypothetical protein
MLICLINLAEISEYSYSSSAILHALLGVRSINLRSKWDVDFTNRPSGLCLEVMYVEERSRTPWKAGACLLSPTQSGPLVCARSRATCLARLFLGRIKTATSGDMFVRLFV